MRLYLTGQHLAHDKNSVLAVFTIMIRIPKTLIFLFTVFKNQYGNTFQVLMRQLRSPLIISRKGSQMLSLAVWGMCLTD